MSKGIRITSGALFWFLAGIVFSIMYVANTDPHTYALWLCHLQGGISVLGVCVR